MSEQQAEPSQAQEPTAESPSPSGSFRTASAGHESQPSSPHGLTSHEATSSGSSAGWESGSEAESEYGGEGGAGTAGSDAFTFDRAATSRHAYLGDNLEDLESSRSPLVEGQAYTLPLFPLEGIVLCPGDTLPLRLQHPADQALAQRALQAAPPISGLIAVACLVRSQRGWRAGIPGVGCLAEIRQLRLQEDASLSLLCKGRQRVVFPAEGGRVFEDMTRVTVRMLPDLPTLRLPREVASHACWWQPWAYRPFDAAYLADTARRLLAAVAPRAPSFHGDPLALSYWLVSNLPLDDATRQQLLEAHSAVERLQQEVQLLREMGAVRCRRCHARVGSLHDALQMSEGGVSGCYVNPHGVVHDICTLSKVRGITLEGSPQTESSWFPGFAWTVAYCRACWHHLGWRFTAVQPGLRPASFWGLRRSAIQSSSWTPAEDPGGSSGGEGSSREEDSQEEEEEEQEPQGLVAVPPDL